jgi:hypothetical protein
MKQLEFNLPEGKLKKEEGMALAATGREGLLGSAREMAMLLCEKHGTCTTDDVRYALDLRPADKANQQNWIGSIFKDSRFEGTNEYVKSRIPRNHAAVIQIWRLK